MKLKTNREGDECHNLSVLQSIKMSCGMSIPFIVCFENLDVFCCQTQPDIIPTWGRNESDGSRQTQAG